MNVPNASLVRTLPSPGKQVTGAVGPCGGDGLQLRGKSGPLVVAPPILSVREGGRTRSGGGVPETANAVVPAAPLSKSVREDTAIGCKLE